MHKKFFYRIDRFLHPINLCFYLLLTLGIGNSKRSLAAQDLFSDLALVSEIDKYATQSLPFLYNYSMVGGYFTMPSARIPPTGMFAAGGGLVPPYALYGVNIGVYSRLELAANYRVFRGILESNFGKEGFGDDADRIANAKIGLLVKEDGFEGLPEIAIGFDDFIGTKRFQSTYLVATQRWNALHLEASLGWGSGRIDGPFGALAWSPFSAHPSTVLQGLSFVAEYDGNHYKKHLTEHSKGRALSSHINGGIHYSIANTLRFAASSIRGEDFAWSLSAQVPLGSTPGLFAKTQDPPYAWAQPQRPQELACSIPHAFVEQGLDLYAVASEPLCSGQRRLWIQIVNNRYREEIVLRHRLECLLAGQLPSDYAEAVVSVESEGVTSHRYLFRNEDLHSFQVQKIAQGELDLLSPMREASCWPSPYQAVPIYHRKRDVWTFSMYPRILTFFGSSTGKFKYSLGALAAAEGYLPGALIYRVQGGYDFYSSMHGLTGSDRLNPSFLPQVRSDSARYYKARQVDLEEAFLQRSWNIGKGHFCRLAAGYFEPGYGGTAAEWLCFPVDSDWAIGLEGAVVWKRHYSGLGFFNRIPQLSRNHELEMKKFIGLQGFFHLHYDFTPWKLNFDIALGQFLAKDKGVRILATRRFDNGLRFSLWAAFTNGNDRVNGHRYFDKGFAFEIPFDLFLRQSSRTFLGYAMSAWLRDVGATAETGTRLYPTLREERTNP